MSTMEISALKSEEGSSDPTPLPLCMERRRGASDVRASMCSLPPATAPYPCSDVGCSVRMHMSTHRGRGGEVLGSRRRWLELSPSKMSAAGGKPDGRVEAGARSVPHLAEPIPWKSLLT